VLLTLRLERRPGRQQQAWSFDAMGLVLFIAFITPVLLALQEAQRMSASALPGFIALTAIGVAALLGLILRERRAAHPLLPIHLLRQPTIWRSDALAACHGATLVSLVTFLPIYLRVLRGTSPSETGLLLLPLMLGIGAGSMATGRIVSRTGRTAVFSVGLIFVAVALVLLGVYAGDLALVIVALPRLRWSLHGHRHGRRAGDGAERRRRRRARLRCRLRAAVALHWRRRWHRRRRHGAVRRARAEQPTAPLFATLVQRAPMRSPRSPRRAGRWR
jgi:hypothetical protein